METIDLAAIHKDLYKATRKPQEITADSGTFLAADGRGAPGGEVFHTAIIAMYSTAYTLKFTLKMAGTLDFKVGRLECLYLSDPATTKMDDWEWRMLIRIPAEVETKDINAVKKRLRDEKGINASAVKRLRWKEGRAVQVLHVGPYDQVCGAYECLGAYAAEHGLDVTGPAHEIYLSDPQRCAPEKLKTIIRLGVKKA
ncbi:MAG TPA: GyrI-like domain-containing protein [Candidatus Hydrogenedentes bacterium]|nr:GyrI-like domain-containing protein [Candidatus Hydrogenedentota bacterium]HPG66072.1 GyrI-like domain-containing protein [Candidatus Hydrogenedentota bacterium]